MDIGLHLSAVKELLPAVHSSDRQRVVSTNYLDNITPVAENVVFDDMKYQARFFTEEDRLGTRKYRRSVYSKWNKRADPTLPIFDEQDNPQYIETDCQEDLVQNTDASCNTNWEPGGRELSEDSPLHERER